MSKEKDEMRKRLASLSFTEKIKILEKLRGRSLTLAAVGLRRMTSTTNRSHNTDEFESHKRG